MKPKMIDRTTKEKDDDVLCNRIYKGRPHKAPHGCGIKTAGGQNFKSGFDTSTYLDSKIN